MPRVYPGSICWFQLGPNIQKCHSKYLLGIILFIFKIISNCLIFINHRWLFYLTVYIRYKYFYWYRWNGWGKLRRTNWTGGWGKSRRRQWYPPRTYVSSRWLFPSPTTSDPCRRLCTVFPSWCRITNTTKAEWEGERRGGDMGGEQTALLMEMTMEMAMATNLWSQGVSSDFVGGGNEKAGVTTTYVSLGSAVVVGEAQWSWRPHQRSGESRY